MSKSNNPSRELFKKFKVDKFLGKGSYGSVYRVKRLDDNKTYAVKETDCTKMNQLEKADAVNEIRLLASIKHPNVIRYHEAFVDGQWLCIVMECAQSGDLSRFVKKGAELKKQFPEDIIWKFFLQIVQGVGILHSNKILHRDIKPMNIFVGENDVVKIGDLGIAKILKGGMARTQIGTPHYMPPEIWAGKPYSFGSDMWSLGCLLYEMISYKVPFDARSINELRAKVTAVQYTPLDPAKYKYSPTLLNLVKNLLNKDPSKRPKCVDILGTPEISKKMVLLPTEAGERRKSDDGGVLSTIKVPVGGNMRLLNAKLPKHGYDGADAAGGKLPAVGGRRVSVA